MVNFLYDRLCRESGRLDTSLSDFRFHLFWAVPFWNLERAKRAGLLIFQAADANQKQTNNRYDKGVQRHSGYGRCGSG